MTTSAIRVTRHEHVVEIELNRPDALNALSTALAREVVDVTSEIARTVDARAVVLTAAGDRAFCVGADLKERNAMSDDDLRAQRVVFRAAFGGVLQLPQPVVAAVHGFALGGGCELALSCDIVVGDETAVLGLPEVTIGLVPGGGGTQLALRRLGAGRAADVVLTGRRLPAGEAHAPGLLHRPGAAARPAPAEARAGRPSSPPSSPPPTPRWRPAPQSARCATAGDWTTPRRWTSRTPRGGP